VAAAGHDVSEIGTLVHEAMVRRGTARKATADPSTGLGMTTAFAVDFGQQASFRG
jgi:hypothetical protein